MNHFSSGELLSIIVYKPSRRDKNEPKKKVVGMLFSSDLFINTICSM